jgi:hypothetical protein
MERTNTPAFIKGLLATCAVAAVIFGTSTARAGAVLISRDSTIRATGTSGASDYDLQDGSQGFDGFSDLVDTADAGLNCPRVAANQNSRPAVSLKNGFEGAYAEGSATIDPTSASALGASNASSTFNLTFEIKDVPSLVNIGGAVGLSGDGATTLSLTNKGTSEVVLERQILVSDGEGQSVEHQTVLNPGVYELAVEASANAEPDQSMAYYTLSLSVSNLQSGGVQSGDNGGRGVQAVPLPPAILSAGMLLGTGGVVRGLRKWRRQRTAVATV